MAYTLQELREQYPNILAGLNDPDAIHKIAQLTGENPQVLAKEYGVIASGQGDFARGISSGLDSLIAGAGGLAAWAGAATGVDVVRDWGYEVYKKNMGYVELRAVDYDDITKAENFGDYVDSAQFWVGYGITQILGAVVAGKGTGMLAKKAIERQLRKGMEKQFGKNIGAINAVIHSNKTQKLITSATKTGALTGVGTQAVGTELGFTYGGAVDEQLAQGKTIEDVDLARATGYGLAAGATEFASDVFLLGLGKFGPAGNIRGLRNLLSKDGKFTSGSRAVNAAVRGTLAAGAEAGTEMVQTGLEEMGAGKTWNEADFLDPTSAWAGAWGGGPVGMVGGLATKKIDPNAKINEELKKATEGAAEEAKQIDQAQAQADADAADFEAQIKEQEDLRDAHSETFPSQKAWLEEQTLEKELVQRAQLQDPKSELSIAFEAWRKRTQNHLSNDPKENEILIKKFLKKHNTDTTGTTQTQDLRDAHIAALDRHAALQEAKKERTPKKQAEIDKAIKDLWERREKALAEGDTKEILAVEGEIADLDAQLPNELVLAEWEDQKRTLGDEAILAEAAAAETAAAEAAAAAEAEKATKKKAQIIDVYTVTESDLKLTGATSDTRKQAGDEKTTVRPMQLSEAAKEQKDLNIISNQQDEAYQDILEKYGEDAANEYLQHTKIESLTGDHKAFLELSNKYPAKEFAELSQAQLDDKEKASANAAEAAEVLVLKEQKVFLETIEGKGLDQRSAKTRSLEAIHALAAEAAELKRVALDSKIKAALARSIVKAKQASLAKAKKATELSDAKLIALGKQVAQQQKGLKATELSDKKLIALAQAILEAKKTSKAKKAEKDETAAEAVAVMAAEAAAGAEKTITEVDDEEAEDFELVPQVVPTKKEFEAARKAEEEAAAAGEVVAPLTAEEQKAKEEFAAAEKKEIGTGRGLIGEQLELDSKVIEDMAPPVNPFEATKFRTVKGKKVITKKWQRFDDAVKEFGQDFETQYEFLRTAIYKKGIKDSTYDNRLEEARELQRDREIVGGIFGKEMRVMGQVQFTGEWQRRVVNLLLDATERGSLHDYLFFQDGKWKFSHKSIAQSLGIDEPTDNQRKAIEKSLNAYRAKQELYGEMSEERETVGEFLDRTLRKMKRAQRTETEEISTAEVEKQIAANEFVGMRIQPRPSDTAVGKKPAFTQPRKDEISKGEIPTTPAKKIKLRLAALTKRVPLLKRAATNAEKKAKAYPKNENLQTLAKSKRRIAIAASDELIGLQDEGKQEVYSKERALLVEERGKAGTALREAKKRLDKSREQKAGKKRLKALEKVVEAKQTALDKAKEEIKALVSPEEKEELAVQRIKDIAARKEGLLPEGTATPEFLKQQEKEQQEGVRIAKQILSDEGAKDDVAGEWGAMRSRDMPTFDNLTPEDKFEWVATVATAINEGNYGSIDVLQNSMERRIRNEEIYSKPKTKDQEVVKGSSTYDTTKKGPGTAADTSGQKDSKRRVTIKEASAYAKNKLGKNWRTKYTNLPKLLINKGLLLRIRNQNFATFNRLVDRYAAQEAEIVVEADKQIIPLRGRRAQEKATTKELIENMFRNLLGQRAFDRIKHRVMYLTPKEATRRWAGDYSSTGAMVMKRWARKNQLDAKQDDGLGDFRERVKASEDGEDTIVFFLENIAEGREAETFMHEIGSHIGLDNILSPSEQAALVTKIKSWAKTYDNFVRNTDSIAIGIDQAVDLGLDQGALTSDEVAAGRAMETVRSLIEKGALETSYPTNMGSQIATRESTKEVKETIAYFITESIHLYGDTGGEFGTIQSEIKPRSVVGKLLNKFRQAFRELIGYQKGETDNLTGQHIIDMAVGAARLELGAERGYSLQRFVTENTGQYVSTIAFMEKMRGKVTARDVTNFRLGDETESFEEGSDQSVTPYWQKKIDAYVASKIPKNDKNKYITENGEYLPPEKWSQWQQSQGRKEKAMRAGLKNIVEQRQREAQKHADIMNDSDKVLIEADRTLNPPARKESKEEVDAIRDWIAKTFNPTVVQIYDNMSHLFFAGTGATKFVHQIINDVAAKMPEAKAWYDAVLLSEKARQKIKMLVEDIIVRARELSKPHLEAVNKFIAKSTTEQLWAYNPHKVGDPRHAEVEAQLKDKSNKQQVWLIKQFNSMTEDQQGIIKDVFTHGEAMLARKRAIAQVIFGKNAPDKFFGTSGLKGPYAPLRRFGNYISEFKSQELLRLEEAYAELDSPENLKKYMDKKGQAIHYRITFHGTIGAAKRDVDENKSSYARSRAFAKSKNVVETRAPEYKVFQKVLAGLNATDLARGSPEFKAIEDMVHDMYFDSLDEDNARHAQVKRQGYAGYDLDMLKGFKANATSEANLIANMEHGKSIYTALANAKKAAHDSGDAKLEQAYNLIVSHHTASLDTKQTVFRALQDKVAAVNTVYMLTSSIGYHVTNATQVMMVTIPKLVGDFGTGNYGKAIGLYIKGLRIASDVVTFNWKKFKFQTHINLDNLTKEQMKYKPLLEELQLRQLLDVGMDQDLAEFGRADSGFKLINKGNEAAGTFAHRLYQVARLVEAYNRISTATAAFELAQDNTSVVTKMGYNNKRTEENSIQYAIRMVEDTQGNFSSIDAPLILKKMPKVTGQYRKYQIMMAWVYADATKKSFAGASPEEKAAGRRTIGVLLGHAGVFSGVVGIPFSHLIAALFMGIGEGDEPEDLERWIQENVQDETLAKMISHGLPSVFGIDMSTKLSQQKIFHPAPYTDFAMTEDALKAGFFEFLLGPSAATASNMIRSYSYAKEGNAWRAIEYALPKGVRTAMESYRLSTEGYSLRNGDVVSSPGDFSGWQLVVNALGIPATDIKQMKWKRGQQYELSAWFSETQSRLRREYVKAKKERRSGDVRTIIEEWKRLQKSKDRVRPFFNNERSALKKTPLASLFKATRQQLEREAKYLAQLKP